MTFQRDDLEKGFEPDECWWIAHEEQVRRKTEFDFKIDPAPDLAVEIEMSRSLVNRISIYAAIGVAEIWRFDGSSCGFVTCSPMGHTKIARAVCLFPFSARLICYPTWPSTTIAMKPHAFDSMYNGCGNKGTRFNPN
ncbi:MAG: Uma2 family endonuclease [Pirellulaceae bacterium]